MWGLTRLHIANVKNSSLAVIFLLTVLFKYRETRTNLTLSILDITKNCYIKNSRIKHFYIKIDNVGQTLWRVL